MPLGSRLVLNLKSLERSEVKPTFLDTACLGFSASAAPLIHTVRVTLINDHISYLINHLINYLILPTLALC